MDDRRARRPAKSEPYPPWRWQLRRADLWGRQFAVKLAAGGINLDSDLQTGIAGKTANPVLYVANAIFRSDFDFIFVPRAILEVFYAGHS